MLISRTVITLIQKYQIAIYVFGIKDVFYAVCITTEEKKACGNKINLLEN